MYFWTGMEEIRGTHRVKNKKVLHSIMGDTDMINAMKKGSVNG
jgi:hypothetical protein